MKIRPRTFVRIEISEPIEDPDGDFLSTCACESSSEGVNDLGIDICTALRSVYQDSSRLILIRLSQSLMHLSDVADPKLFNDAETALIEAARSVCNDAGVM